MPYYNWAGFQDRPLGQITRRVHLGASAEPSDRFEAAEQFQKQ